MDSELRYYDETIYLDSNINKDIINYIYFENKEYKEEIRNNFVNNKDRIETYRKYLKFIAYLIRVLSMPDNAICSSILLKLLMDDGTFSNNEQFRYLSSKECLTINDELVGFFGLNVINGNGCCRHIASFQSDVLKEMGYFTKLFYGYISPYEIGWAKDNTANHVINLIEYNNACYGYDVQANDFFGFVNAMKMKNLFGNKERYIYYKPYVDMFLGDLRIKNIKELITAFDKIKDRPLISKKEYLDILNYAKDKIVSENGLIKDFKQSSKKYIKEIIWKK